MGDEAAEDRALIAVSDIDKAGDATEHERNVWVASCYLRLAKGVYDKNRDKAMEYMDKADKIIEIDPVDLKLVKSDLESLRQELA